MNDTPGWIPPGSSPSDPSDRSDDREAPPPGDANQAPHDQPGGNWSAQQPPAAPGWGAPTAPPEGGQGNGAWNQPPAAKPGVIPLRPLGVGEILDGTVSTMRAHWRTVLGIALVVAVISQTVATAALGVWFQDTSDLKALENNPAPTFDEFMAATDGLLGSASVAGLVSLLGSIVATALLTTVFGQAVLGRSMSIRDAWHESRAQLPKLFGLLLVLLLMVLVVLMAGPVPGIVLSPFAPPEIGVALALLGSLAGVVFAVWLWVRFSLAAPALMLEKQGLISALRRSAKLVRGSWWRVLGIQLLGWLLVLIVSGIVELPTDLIGRFVDGGGASGLVSGELPTGLPYLVIAGIGAVISSTITLPISAGVTALLYLDLRIRREALDIELTRAAGGPDPASQQADGPAPGS